MTNPPGFPVSLAQDARLTRYVKYGHDHSARNARSQITGKIFAVSGSLDVEALSTAARLTALAHTAFRTLFVPSATPGVSRQVLTEETRFESIRITDSNPVELEKAVAAAATKEFDIEAGALGRLVIGSASSTDHIVALALEHLISDGWSLGIMLADIQSVYGSLVVGGETPALSSSVQHMIAIKEREWLAGTDGQKAGKFWRAELGDVGPMVPLRIPGTRIPSGSDRVRSTWHVRHIDSGGVSALHASARERRMTIGALYTAATAEAGRRSSSVDDLSVISPMVNRHDRSAFKTIAWASNIVTFRFRGFADLDIPARADAAREVYMRAMAHSRYPVHQIDLDLSPEMFGTVNTEIPQLYLDTGGVGHAFALKGLQVTQRPAPSHQVPLGLAIWMRPTEDGGLDIELAHPAGYMGEDAGSAIADVLVDVLKSYSALST